MKKFKKEQAKQDFLKDRHQFLKANIDEIIENIFHWLSDENTRYIEKVCSCCNRVHSFNRKTQRINQYIEDC